MTKLQTSASISVPTLTKPRPYLIRLGIGLIKSFEDGWSIYNDMLWQEEIGIAEPLFGLSLFTALFACGFACISPYFFIIPVILLAPIVINIIGNVLIFLILAAWEFLRLVPIAIKYIGKFISERIPEE